MRRAGAIVSGVLAAFLALCCLGWAPALALLGAAGLGFLVSDAVLVPLLAVSLAALILIARPFRAESKPGSEP